MPCLCWGDGFIDLLGPGLELGTAVAGNICAVNAVIVFSRFQGFCFVVYTCQCTIIVLASETAARCAIFSQ